MFESLTLDGYFTGKDGDLSWSHGPAQQDPEWMEFVSGNASGGGALLFGRVTFEMMRSFWPTPQAAKDMPKVAKAMNEMPKFVVSKTLKQPDWQNTTILSGDLVEDVMRLKASDGPNLTILGSGRVVSRLAATGLVDSYQFVLIPVAIGVGRPLFEDMHQPLALQRVDSRSFRNGNVVVTYAPEPAAVAGPRS